MSLSSSAPWLKYYGNVPQHLSYPQKTIYQMVKAAAERNPKLPAYEFMGKKTTFTQFMQKIDETAQAFLAMGIKKGDRVTICMPNCPQAIYLFYAINLVGGIANMVHPLSAEKEIEFYLNESESVTAITLDQFYNKFESVRKNTKVVNIIIASIKDALAQPIKAGYMLTQGRKIEKIPEDAPVIRWQEFVRMSRYCFYDYKISRTADDPAVILYSGGTTGTTKGILLSNLNFNALGTQTIAMATTFEPGQSMLAAMPIFHGFGLGVCIHTILIAGGTSILVPRVSVESYARLLKKEQPTYIAGVPTLFEGITRNPYMREVNLACLRGVFSGGDSLSIELKKKFDLFLREHGATVQVREGYGTTECVTASCLTPYDMYREGSIGLPFPDTYYKIVRTGTTDELPYGQEGEICLTGPSMMLGYVNQPEETANAMRVHPADGLTWVHTGDLGYMDEDGFVYFRQRIKRMIVTSGYNVYPSQLENIIDAHEAVQMSCVIGVPDSYKMQKVKAFIVLRDGVAGTPELMESIWAHCRRHIAKYAMPYDIEFRDELPKTLVGKVAYRVLEEEELGKLQEPAPVE